MLAQHPVDEFDTGSDASEDDLLVRDYQVVLVRLRGTISTQHIVDIALALEAEVSIGRCQEPMKELDDEL